MIDETKSNETTIIGKRIKIGEKDFDVSDDVASALTDYETNMKQSVDEIRNQYEQKLAQLVGMVKQPSTPEGTTKKGIDPDRVFTDTGGFINDLMEEVETRITKAKTEATNQIATERQVAEFWNQFWKSNTDLDRDEDALIAESIADRHAGEWSRMTVEGAMKKLAEETRKKISGIVAKRTKESIDSPKDEPVLHSGGIRSFSPAGKPVTEEKTKSLGDLIRERQALRFGNKQ